MAGIGRVGRQTRKYVQGRTDLAGVALITAEMAISVSDLVDAARIGKKPREMLAALKELRELLRALDQEVVGGESGGGAGGAAEGGAGGQAEELEYLLGAGPALGH